MPGDRFQRNLKAIFFKDILHIFNRHMTIIKAILQMKVSLLENCNVYD